MEFLYIILVVVVLIILVISKSKNKAYANLGKIGKITFTEHPDGTEINGTFYNLPPGKHGIHIHDNPSNIKNLRDCDKLGGHFNPTNSPHGDRTNPIRHTGDMGNIEIGPDGRGTLIYVDDRIKVADIIGKAVVIHSDEDDGGMGGHDDSHANGHSGARLGCAIIV